MAGLLRVSHVQRFSLHDGPGVRTTVFVQGCPLRCWWCHNPETRPTASEASRPWAIGELVAELERDARYWRTSGGGVTVSGGEPLMQAAAVAELGRALRERGHHVTIDTSGAAALEAVQQVSPVADLWLWDVKAVDAEVYRRATGGDAERSLAGLAWVLGATATPVRVRVPVIRGVNDNASAATAIADWLAAQPRQPEVELLTGHDLGRRRPTPTAAPDPDRVLAAADILRDRHLPVLVAGGGGAATD